MSLTKCIFNLDYSKKRKIYLFLTSCLELIGIVYNDFHIGNKFPTRKHELAWEAAARVIEYDLGKKYIHICCHIIADCSEDFFVSLEMQEKLFKDIFG